MSRNIEVDTRDLENFSKNIAAMAERETDEFIRSCAKELAARLLRKVIKRTKPGQYPKNSGRVGGTLRRGWTGGTSRNAAAYAESLGIRQSNGSYVIDITNPIEYASYVEYGHRTRNHKKWVNGKFYLMVSEKELQDSAPAILEKKLARYMEEHFK